MDEEEDRHANFCPDCEAMFFEDEEGYDQDECMECGGTDCYEVPA